MCETHEPFRVDKRIVSFLIDFFTPSHKEDLHVQLDFVCKSTLRIRNQPISSSENDVILDAHKSNLEETNPVDGVNYQPAWQTIQQSTIYRPS